MSALRRLSDESPHSSVVDIVVPEQQGSGRGLAADGWALGVARAAADAVKGGACLHGENGPATAVEPVVQEYVAFALRGFTTHTTPSSAVPPASLPRYVYIALRQGVTLYQLLHAISVARQHIVDRYILSLPGHHPSRGDRLSITVTRAEVFSRSIAETYLSDSDVDRSARRVERARVTCDVVAGRPVDLAEVERVLELDMSDHHLAVMLWSLRDESAPTDELGRFAKELKRSLGARRMLLSSTAPRSACLWLSWRHPPGERVLRSRVTLAPPPWLRAGFGPIAPGLEGFRRSYVGAMAVSRAPMDDTLWFRDYRDVALMSLVMADTEQAQCFVRETLGALADPDPGVAEMRETLRTYLAYGRSRIHAANQLHVARNTVAYRVAKAVRLLGRVLERDEVNVRIALEIAHLTSSGSN